MSRKDNEFYLLGDSSMYSAHDYSGIMIVGNDKYHIKCIKNKEGKKDFMKCEWVAMKKTGIELKDDKTIGSMLKQMGK